MAGACLVMAFAGNSASAMAGATPEPAQLEILDYVHEDSGRPGELEKLEGSISSSVQECALGRTVTVLQKRPGSDEVIGSAESQGTSADNGLFEVIAAETVSGSRELEPGKYYATVDAEAIGAQACAAGTSKTFEVDAFSAKLEFEYRISEDGSREFLRGFLKTKEANCAHDREVLFYRVRHGRDLRFGSAQTLPAPPRDDGVPLGFFSLAADRQSGRQEFRPGTYVVKVRRTDKCSGTESKGARVKAGEANIDLGYFFFPSTSQDPEREFFEGFLAAPARRCHEGRRVAIYRQRPGSDEKVATVEAVEFQPDRSRYFYVYPETANNQQEGDVGTYYAETLKERDCETVRSNTVEITN